MSTTVDSLILDLLEWIGPNPRLYTEVIEAWRTSCPRLPVWEEATERGLIVSHYEPGRETVLVTALGAEHLRTHRHANQRTPVASSLPRLPHDHDVRCAD